MLQRIKAMINKTKQFRLYQKYRTFIRFAIVGCINTGIDFISFTILHGLFSINKFPSQIIAYTLGIINSFIMNKIWSFGVELSIYRTQSQIPRFIFVNALSLTITLIGLRFANDTLGINVYLSKVIATILAQLVNYFGYKLVVFRKKKTCNQ
ncbi:MAG: GtrA family protein [Clostridiaceae bacterium]|nr:GtrA family protein [Clostridiaceae bacterium]